MNTSEGYVKGNVQWVHKDINLMKNALDQEYFVNLCTKVVIKSKKEVRY